jgi:hypothetical protein
VSDAFSLLNTTTDTQINNNNSPHRFDNADFLLSNLFIRTRYTANCVTGFFVAKISPIRQVLNITDAGGFSAAISKIGFNDQPKAR